MLVFQNADQLWRAAEDLHLNQTQADALSIVYGTSIYTHYGHHCDLKMNIKLYYSVQWETAKDMKMSYVL